MRLRLSNAILLACMLQTNTLTHAHSKKHLVKSIQNDLTTLQHSIQRFWACHGLDHEQGGFHGTLTRSGAITTPTTKGLVQQTRHIWAFSTFYLHGHNIMPGHSTFGSCDNYSDKQQQQQQQAMQQVTTPPEQAASITADNPASTSATTTGSELGVASSLQSLRTHHYLPTSQQMAASAYAFTITHLRDPSDGLFYWMVSRDGNTIVQNNKVLYGQWFVLYGLSAYHDAFGDHTAQQWALQCFRAMDTAWHNSSTGGYNESPDNSIPPDPAPESDIEQLPTPTRTLNALMHGLEALTALHRVSHDPVVLARMLELLDILCSRLQRVQGLIFEGYEPGRTLDQLWRPTPGQVVNYGHNLEVTWLVADSLEYLESIQAINPALANQYLRTAMSIGAAAVHHGFDNIHGGLFEYGQPETGPQSLVKVWWIQAESTLALWKLYEYYNDMQYLRQLAATTHFTAKYVNDGQFGEQFWQVEPDGTYRSESDPAGGNKGNRWKASYHSSRATLFLQRWMKGRAT